MRTVQDQIEQNLQAMQRHRRLQVERPSGWIIMLKVTSLLMAVIVLILVFTAGQIAYYGFRNPTVTILMRQEHRAANRAGLEQDIYQKWVALNTIPRSLQNAILLAQDEQFFFHDGFQTATPEEVTRPGTILSTWRQQRSSITNQVVRNLLLGRSRDDAVYMMRERLCTTMMELVLSKDRILELYLNTVPLGPGVYGVDKGAWHHFGLASSRLTIEQSCRLAVVSQSPMALRVYQDNVTDRAIFLADRMGIRASLPIATLPGSQGQGGIDRTSM